MFLQRARFEKLLDCHEWTRDRRLDGGLVCLSIGPSKKSGTYMMCARSLRNKVAEIEETDWLRAMLVSVAGWRGLSRGHFRKSSLQIDDYQEAQTTCTTMINCNAVDSSMRIVTCDRHL